MIKRTFADIPIYEFEEIDSTNKYALEELNSLKAEFLDSSSWIKAVITARQQTDGKGRRDRQWLSKKDGSLLVSFILDPKFFGSMLDTTLLISCANEVLVELGVRSSLKWPNDIIIDEGSSTRKLAGVLTQIAGDFIVVGIGVNISKIGEDLLENTACINEFEISITSRELLDLIIQKILAIEESDFTHQKVLDRYKNVCSSLSKQVRVESINETIEGKVIDIAITGALVLEMGDGRVLELSEGDVIHLR